MKTVSADLPVTTPRPASEYAALLIAAVTVILFLSAWFSA